jgi:hypothetical protein
VEAFWVVDQVYAGDLPLSDGEAEDDAWLAAGHLDGSRLAVDECRLGAADPP